MLIYVWRGIFEPYMSPLGGSKTRMENAPSKSIKFYISMFSDKPLCMPLCFGTAVIILPEAVGAFSSFLASAAAAVSLLAPIAATFSSFLAFATGAFSLVFSSAFSSYLAFFFHFLFFLRLFLQPFLLS